MRQDDKAGGKGALWAKYHMTSPGGMHPRVGEKVTSMPSRHWPIEGGT